MPKLWMCLPGLNINLGDILVVQTAGEETEGEKAWLQELAD